MTKVFSKLLSDDTAASMTEYALLLALIAVAAIGALQVLGGNIDGVYTTVSDEKERQEKLIEILTEGIYDFLREEGLLRKDSAKEQKVTELLSHFELNPPIPDTSENE